MSEEPRKILLGVFDNATHVVVPAQAIQRATAAFDAEKQKRQKLASAAKTKALQDARNRGKLKRALTACGFRRGRRGR